MFMSESYLHIKKNSNLSPIWWILWFTLVMAIVGCATVGPPTPSKAQPEDIIEKKPSLNPKTVEKKAPPKKEHEIPSPESIAAWIPKGSGAFTINTTRQFHGIGGSTSRNPILLRASADNRSREELSNILIRFLTFVTETYWNKDGGQESSAVGNLKILKETFFAVAEETLSNSRIAGHWQDPESGEYYSLCRLSLSDLITGVAKDTRLDRRSQEYFLKNAEKLYDEFSGKSGVKAS
jgi:hypothetical protein